MPSLLLVDFRSFICICAQDDNVPVCSLRSLQEAQRQTDETFQQFMTDSLQANWQQAKRRLLDSMLPSGGQGGFAHSAVPAALGQSDSRSQAKPGMLPASLRDRKLSVRPPTNASRCSLHAENKEVQHALGLHIIFGPSGPTVCFCAADAQSAGQKVQLSGRFRNYAETAARLNASYVSGQPFDAVAEFAKACTDEDTGAL